MVSPDTTVMDAIAQMSGVRSLCNTTRTADSQLDDLHLEARSSCVLVVENEQLVGVLTERDVVRLSARQRCLENLVLREVMTHPVVTLRESAFTDLFLAINLLQQHHIRHLPILDELDRLVGLVTHESLRQISRPLDLLRLRMVAEVMTREVICAAPDSSLLAIVQLMAEHRVSSVMIVHPGGISTEPLQMPVGIVTERDIVQFQALGLKLETCRAEAVMSTPIFKVKPEESLLTVQQIMEQRSICRLAVTGEQGELLGIVTQISLLQALNPLELYKLVQKWEEKVVRLEAEKVALLANRNLEIEQQVETRTAALNTKVQREKLLADLATQIRSSLSLQTILDTTVQQVRQVLGCDRVNIWRFEADREIIVVAESTDSSLSLLGQRVNDTCFKQDNPEIYRQGQVRVVPDISTANISEYHRQMLIRLQTQAKIVVPLLCGDKLWGLLNASESQHARDWQPEEVELVQALSVHLAIAIGQATIHQKLQNELIKRQRIEATLIDSEERYAALAAAAPVGIFRTDAEGLCTYVNDRYFQISRFTPEATIGDAWQQGLHPDDRDWVIAQWEQFIQGNDSFELEYRFQRPDGEVTWIYGQCVPELDANGHRIGSIGTITDISDRKRTEAFLQESEERYATLVEVSPVGIFRTDPGGNCIYVNDRWCQISGLTPKAAIGEGWRRGLYPEDTDSIALEWQQSAQQNRPFRLEYRFQRPDGAVAWVYGQSVAELDADGQVVGYVGAITDISDRKLAETALIQSEAQSRAILAAVPDFMFRIGADGIYRGSVTAHRQLDFLGTDFDTPGVAMVDLISGEIATRHLHHLEQALRTGELQVYEQQVHIGPRLQYEEVRVIKSGEDEALFMIRDVTDRKQAERQLYQLNQQLEAKVEERTQELWQVNSLQRAILDGADYSIISTDPTGIIQTFNAGAERMLGYSAAEVVGKCTPELIHDANEVIDRAASLSAELRQNIPPGFEVFVAKARQGILSEEEWSYIRKDGSRFPVSLSISILKDVNQQIIGFLGIAKDISDRKQAELERQQLIQELSAFKQALDQSAIVVITDAEGVISYVNDRFSAISGYSRDELMGKTHRLLNSGYHPPAFFQDLWQTIASGHVWRGEVCNQAKNGSLYWVASTIVPFLDEGGRPFQYLAIRFDITDRKLAQATIQQENTFRQQIVENMTEGLCVFYEVEEFPFLCFTVWNQQMQAITGYTLEDINRLGWYHSLYPNLEYREQGIADLKKMGRGNLIAVEREIRRQDGQCRTISISTSILSMDDEHLYVLSLIQDITERQQTERENGLLKERLEFLLASSPAMIYSCKPNGDYDATFVSKNIEVILGYKPEEFLSESGFWANHIHPEDAPRVFAHLSALFEHNTHQHEYRFLHRDGHYVWLRDELRLLLDEEGKPIEIVGYFADISDVKQTQETLKRQLAAIEAAIDGIAIMQADTYLYVNQAHLELFGYEHPQELVGKTWKLLYSQHELERFEREVLPVLGCNRAWEGEAIATRKDGSTFAEGLSLTLTEDGLLICVCRDISDRKQIEAQLAESEAKFRRLVEGANDLIWSCEPDGILTYLSPQFKTMFGWEESEWMGKSSIYLVHPDDRPLLVTGYRENVKLGKKSSDYEFRYRHRDGNYVWVRSSATPVINAEGELISIQGILSDISDRKQAQKALQESQQFLQTVLDTIPLAVFWKNRESVYLGCNQQFAKTLGLPSTTESIGKTDLDICQKEVEANGYCAMDRRLMQTGEAILWIEETLTLPNGKTIFVETNKSPLRDCSGNIIGLVGTFQDITDRKEAEARLQQQAKQERLLGAITKRMRSSLNLDEILNSTVEEIHQLLQSDRTLVYQIFPEGTGAVIAESVSPNTSKLLDILFPDEVFPQENYDRYIQGRVYALNDSEDENESILPCLVEFLAEIQVRAKLVVPIIQNHTLWGLLIVHQCDSPRQWQEWEINLLKQIANQLAIAIQQSYLYEQVQSELAIRKQTEKAIALQLQRQRTLGEITQQIRESLDIKQILATVTQQVKEILQGDRIIVIRLFGNGRSQIVEESVLTEFAALKNLHWDDQLWSQEILNHYCQGKPRIVPDIMTDMGTNCLVEYASIGQVKSKMVAPILQEVRSSESHRGVAAGPTNKLWGVLVVHACREKRVWQESELLLLQQIANQLAIAVQQASLFEQLQQQLTERQQAQQQLTERNQQLGASNEELARATRLKDEFLANMSHELRTPLNAIMGMSEGLQEQVFGIVNEQQIKALQTIERSSSHLLELINDILDVAKIESGQMELDCTPVSINHLCQSSLPFIKQQALQKRIQLEIKVPLNLPDLLIDERRMRQVLINLLNNAVKFTPNGGRITLEVSVQQRRADPDSADSPPDFLVKETLQIAVVDTGIGIASEDINKLFQPFIQIDGALNRQYQGTGLGLALVKRIVELHGGQVGLTSEVGVGSCFTIDLPYTGCCAPSSVDLESQTEPRIEPSGPEQQGGSPLILLAEDNEANISTVSSYLKAKGYRILLAKNGEEAIALAKSENPNLILMDISMPGMDGLEAMQQIRLDPSLVDLPIVALTALAMTGDRDRCLAAGANDYLTKPIKLKQLVATIQHLLTSLVR